MIAENTKWRVFERARFIPESQSWVIYPGSIIWFLGKATQKKKTPGNLTQRSNTSGSSSARSIEIILTSRQQPLRPSTLLHQWPGQPSDPLPPRSGNKAVQPRTLANALEETELEFYDVFERFSVKRVVYNHFDPLALTLVSRTQYWPCSAFSTHRSVLLIYLLRKSVGFPPYYPSRLGGFSSTAPHKSNRLVILPSHPIRFGVFFIE